MPQHSDISTAVQHQLLAQFGARLKQVRLEAGMSSSTLAQQVGISRTTLQAVELGASATAISTYMRVLCALGLAADFAMLASGAAPHMAAQAPRRQVIEVDSAADTVTHPILVKIDSGSHMPEDLQSLLLHQEAVRLIRKSPALVNVALDTLTRWRAKGPSRSAVLWDQWAQIIGARDWPKAVANTQRGQQLRQASPLSTLVPEATRLRIIAQIQALKVGVELSRR